jgi:hypothetical protein
MGNETEPYYTSEELSELYDLLLNRCLDELILIPMSAFSDDATLRNWTKEWIDNIPKNVEIETDKAYRIHQVMFCKFNDIALHINSYHYKVVAWRLEHGK